MLSRVTCNLIKTFVKEGDLHDVGSIIIAMQEEDNVADTLGYRNCFKLLRNLAAHEPSVLYQGLCSAGKCKILYFNKEDGGQIAVDICVLTAYMFTMYLRTEQFEYIMFIVALTKLLFKSKLLCKCDKPLAFTRSNSVLKYYMTYRNYMVENYDMLTMFDDEDARILDLYGTNKTVFWKIAIPDFSKVWRVFMSGLVDLREPDNINAYIELFDVREGLMSR